MRPAQIEAWVLSLVDQITAGKRVEDSRVELKAQWPEPQTAARRIAGHANASGGDPILWVIGLDETRGVVSVDPVEFADWWAQAKKEFDGIEPLVTDLTVPASGGTLIALLFDTSRRPYVVKNPAYGKPGSGPVTLEVPWRTATAVHSARREDLIRLLAPMQSLKALAYELEYNAHAATTSHTPKFATQQFARTIAEGSLALLENDLRQLVFGAYAAMETANNMLDAIWTQPLIQRHSVEASIKKSNCYRSADDRRR